MQSLGTSAKSVLIDATDIDTTGSSILRIDEDRAKVIDSYIWQYDCIPLSQNPKMVLSEMHIATFLGEESTDSQHNKHSTQRLGLKAS